MKKSSIILGIVVLLVCIYCCADGAPSAATKGDNMQITTIIENGGCLECHTAEPKLPFYAELPLAGDVVKKDAYQITTAVGEGALCAVSCVKKLN